MAASAASAIVICAPMSPEFRCGLTLVAAVVMLVMFERILLTMQVQREPKRVAFAPCVPSNGPKTLLKVPLTTLLSKKQLQFWVNCVESVFETVCRPASTLLVSVTTVPTTDPTLELNFMIQLLICVNFGAITAVSWERTVDTPEKKYSSLRVGFPLQKSSRNLAAWQLKSAKKGLELVMEGMAVPMITKQTSMSITVGQVSQEFEQLGFLPRQHLGGQAFWQVQQQSKQGQARMSKKRPMKKGAMKTMVPVPLICISVMRSPELELTSATTIRVAFAFMQLPIEDWQPELVLRSDCSTRTAPLVQYFETIDNLVLLIVYSCRGSGVIVY